ncbi:PPOX class F420-dependent oxidoreductase [Nocardia cyriacigeorgica]|uniref:PPOX class F420-dependent oxidoreductase n=1 Tax=Nocardia cyriacigeorgica TaxID=135487 RepID=A0A6P1DCI8_9NOCA|nr:PPOX class F420-dependent oxidoreductase [Nocardia cyriacigeorgica]NEW37362.1 PPOX class F420-dependent oxidoreductase [Nocardia cyriacigeorgica]NEW47918.1 PPOX class F420-dependent oxidoreductase [Nocardia cyriacigeorgica]NEW50561.1 PPOX class F420-dependent oxidoreductase [Nocardia cyriacigeorgica]NEW57713.1 PPOX class F420-dependent oxidoreductase [Nocardia cyriacigeorgica]
MTWNELASSKYALLTTYKKDGTPVGTPVWVAPDGDRILVWTNQGSWKVKRIRRNPQVMLQECDNRGRTDGGGEIRAGTATILDADNSQHVRDVVASKYGILGALAIGGHKLLRGADASVGIAIAERAA